MGDPLCLRGDVAIDDCQFVVARGRYRHRRSGSGAKGMLHKVSIAMLASSG